jgi:hypothetical protein
LGHQAQIAVNGQSRYLSELLLIQEWARMGVKRDRESRDTCKHREVRSATIAGLRRTVCESCGLVSVGFVKDVFAEERKQLGKHTA